MSDTIIINTNPPVQDSIIINVSPSVSDSINIDTGSAVISVNGKIGVVVLDKCDIGLCNVDDTSDLNKPLSYATISALYLKVDMVDFLTLRSLVTSNSANWNSVYSNVLANSSRWEYAYNTVIGGLSSNLWNSVYTNVNSNSANWQGAHSWVRSNSANATFLTISALSLSGVFYGDGSNLIGASLPGQTGINTVVQSNSANWNSTYTSWNSVSATSVVSYNDTRFSKLSSQAYILVDGTSSIQPIRGGNTASGYYSNISGGISNNACEYYSGIGGGSDNTASGCYSYVGGGRENEANGVCSFIGGGHQNNAFGLGSVVAGGCLNNAYGNYSAVLGGHNNDTNNIENTFILGSNIIAVSANYTYVNNLSSQGLIVANGGNSNQWNSAYTNVNSNSANWNSAYNVATVYQNTSGSFATNTLLQSTSALLTPLTVTNTLTSLLVLNSTFNNYKTDVASSTATLLPTSIYQNASGNWQATFTVVQSNSSNWNSSFNTGTVYSQNSASYATYNYVNSGFLPLSGGTISGATRIDNNLTIFGNLSATGNSYFANTIYSTTSALSVINIGNTGPALYVGNNGTGDIASFYDLDQNIEVLHVGGNNGSFPNVGIKTSEPNVDFTVNGQISANNTIWSAGGNSNNWNSAFNITTTYQNASGSFATNTLLQSTSALLTPLTLTRTLTSQLVTNTSFDNYKTNVAITTATLLPTSVYQNTSGSFVTTPIGDTRYSKLSSQVYKFGSGTNSIQPVSGNNIASGDYSVIVGGGSNSTGGTLLTNVLAYWKFDDDGSGAVSLIDSSGNDLTLINNNNAALGTGKINGAVVLSDNKRIFNNTSFTPTGSNPFSFSTWIKLSEDFVGFVFSYGTPNTNQAVGLYVPTPLHLNLQFWNNGVGDIPVTANEWHHVVGTYDGTTARIYVNGSLRDSLEIGLNIGPNNFYFNQWVNGSTGFGTCSVDEFGIWSRGLSQSEVVSLYSSGTGLPYDSFNTITFLSPSNIASGDYSFIAGGQNNNTNNKDNTFILGSNITAPEPNFTYVNNLSSSGSLVAGTLSARNSIQTDGQIALGNYTFVNNAPAAGSNTGFGITSAPDTYIFKSTPNGEVIFNGPTAFFGFADRTDYTNSTKDGGFYKYGGVINFWNNTLLQNTVSIADNGNVYIGANGYGTYSSDGTTSTMPYAFNVAGETKFASNVYVDGNTGIGTTSPAAKLDVAGNIYAGNQASSYINTIASGGSPEIDFGVGGQRKMVFGYDSNVSRGIFYSDAVGGGIFYYDSDGIAIGDKTGTYSGNILKIPKTWDQVNIDGLITATGGNSTQWNSAYNTATAYQNISGSFATNTLLQSTSALLTPLTLTRTLTSLLVLNSTFNNYQTSVAASTATLLPTTAYQSASGSFATNTALNAASSVLLPTSVYQNTSGSFASISYVNNGFLPLSGGTMSGVIFVGGGNSNQWNNTFATVQANSATTWNYQGTDLKALSGNWNSTYSTVSLLSSTWSAGVSGGGAGDPAVNSLVISNSGYWNTAYVFSTVFSQNSSIYNGTYTTVAANSALWGMGVVPYGELTSALFTGDGSTNTFNLSSTAPFTQSAGYIVSLNGSLQVPDIDYSILYSSGTNRVVTNFVPRLGSSLSVITLSNKPIPNQITTLVSVASANWNSVYNTTNSLSGNWNSVYSYVNSTSSTNNPDYNSSIFAKLSSASSAGGLFYDIKNSDFNAVATKQYLVDTSSNIVVGTLPSSPSVGDTINFEDASGTWFARPFILNNNGNLIESFNESLTANINSYKFKTIFLGGVYGWRLF
jgi:hypothetical protein